MFTGKFCKNQLLTDKLYAFFLKKTICILPTKKLNYYFSSLFENLFGYPNAIAPIAKSPITIG